MWPGSIRPFRSGLLSLLLVPEIDTLWIILGAAVISLSASSIGVLVQMLSGHSLWWDMSDIPSGADTPVVRPRPAGSRLRHRQGLTLTMAPGGGA
jgi:hypothetical protein